MKILISFLCEKRNLPEISHPPFFPVTPSKSWGSANPPPFRDSILNLFHWNTHTHFPALIRHREEKYFYDTCILSCQAASY